MILERLVLKNFKRFRDEEIHFIDGITGIVGNNGTGKSSIVEAILFALYGLSGTGIKPDYIVSSFASSSEKCEVRLDFKVKGRSYSIRRKFRKSSSTQHEVKMNMDGRLLAQTVSEVEREVRRVIGMDAVDLKNTIYAGQKDLNSLIESRPGERKDWFSRALRLDYLKDESLTLIKEQIDAKERDHHRIENEINGMKNVMNEKEWIDNREAIDRYTTVISDLRASLVRLHDRLNQLENEKKELLEQKNLFQRLQENYHSTIKELDGLTTKMEILESESARLVGDVREFEKLKKFEDSYQTKKAEFEIIRNRKYDYEHHKQEQRFLQENIKQISERISYYRQLITNLEVDARQKDAIILKIRSRAQISSDIPDTSLDEALSTKRDELTKQIGALHEAIEQKDRERKKILADWESITRAGEDGVCPLCGQKLGDHFINLEKEFKDRFNQIVLNAQEAINHLEQMEKDQETLIQLLPSLRDIHQLNERLKNLEDLKRELNIRTNESLNLLNTETELHRVIDELHINDDDYKNFDTQMEELNVVHERFNNLARKIAPLPLLQRQQQQIADEINKKMAEKRQIEYAVGNSCYKIEVEQNLEKTIKKLYEDIAMNEQNLVRNTERLQKSKEIVERYQVLATTISDRQRQLDELSEKIRLLKLTRVTIADFILYLMQTVRDQIEYHASMILSDITNGKYDKILLDSDFNVRVSDVDNDYPIERFSGGEQDDIAVALRIALSRYLAELHQVHESTFLIFDEIFGSQDEERRNNLIKALRTQESHFPQIILISHVPELQGEFTNTLLVEMRDDQTSAVKEVG